MRWLTLTAFLVAAGGALLYYFTQVASPNLITIYHYGSLWCNSITGKANTTTIEHPIRAEPWNILEHLGGNSPWIPKTRGIAEGGIDPPEGCVVDQVHMISRHAERYPTIAAGIAMLELYHRIKDSNISLNGSLAFVNTWDFLTGSPDTHFESLVSTGDYAGTLQAFTTGVKLRTRYKHLLDLAVSQNRTAFWASGSKRVIESAQYFGAGFFGLNQGENISTLHIIPETPDRGADTLTPGRTCSRYREDRDDFGHAYGYRMIAAFRSTYEPAIVSRLAAENPDFPFTEAEVFTMQQMCGFDTIVKGKTSPWCDVFTHEEWDAFEYARDVIHYYRAGPGNPYSGAMGWLWLNATAELLEKGPEETGSLFFSFVHDGDIVPLLHALDLFPQAPHLPVTHVPANRTWRTSDVVPMGGRLIFERLRCPVPQHCWSNEPFYPNHVYCEPQRWNTTVRVNVNDGIVAIPGCEGGVGGGCELEEFLERVRRRGREFGEFGTVCGLAPGARERIGFLHQ